MNRKESWRQGPHRGRQLSDSDVGDVPERLTRFDPPELVRDMVEFGSSSGSHQFIGGLGQNVGGVLSQASSLARTIPDSYYRSVY